MTNNVKAVEAANRISLALSSGEPCEPVRDLIGRDDLELAYAVQQINTDKRLANGEQIVGVKVGLTSQAVQQQLGVDQPDFGLLTDKMEVGEGVTIPWDELFQPKAEVEVAFRLGEDLPQKKIDLEELKRSIAGASVSIEIVGSRVKDWDICISDTIADNASASHFTVSSELVDIAGLDLEGCEMQLKRNGELVSEGIGKACLGNPLNAALWLVNKWAELGLPLKKGYWILAGALGPMVVAKPGDHFEAKIQGLGTLNAKFGTTNE